MFTRDDRWGFYTYRFGERGEERCLVRFHVDACDPAKQTPALGRRVIGFSLPDQIAPDGMPSPAAFERLKAIEAHLERSLAEVRASCWLVGIMVYRGMRELIFEVEAPALGAFERAYAAVEAELGGTRLVEFDGWQFFNDKIAPDPRARLQIGNRRVLDALREAGADFSRPHVLDHTFVGDPAALAQVRARVATISMHERGAPAGQVTLSRLESLDLERIDELTWLLHGIAASAGAVYDGWGTMLDAPAPSSAPEVALLEAARRGGSVVAVVRDEIARKADRIVLLKGLRTAFELDLAGAKRIYARATEAADPAADAAIDAEWIAWVRARDGAGTS